MAQKHKSQQKRKPEKAPRQPSRQEGWLPGAGREGRTPGGVGREGRQGGEKELEEK